jgi:hypothetical protein
MIRIKEIQDLHTVVGQKFLHPPSSFNKYLCQQVEHLNKYTIKIIQLRASSLMWLNIKMNLLFYF